MRHHQLMRVLLIVTIPFVIWGAVLPSNKAVGVEPVYTYVRTEAQAFTESAAALHTTLQLLNRQPGSQRQARQALLQCRLQYKRLEFFLEYYFNSESRLYNAPARYEVEEPFIEYEAPAGLQVMEALLFDKDVAAQKERLLAQAQLVERSARDLPALLYRFTTRDENLLESLRLELIRVMTTGITGYDAPLLKSGIVESYQALWAVQQLIKPYSERYNNSDTLNYYLTGALQYLQQHTDFDSFNRLYFLTNYALPLQQQLQHLAAALQLHTSTVPALNTATTLFNAAAIRTEAFGVNSPGNEAQVLLGRELFFEKALSGNNTRSCATCHQPDQYFSEKLARSMAFDRQRTVARNAPSLLYSCFQYAQFWDGHTTTLEQQAKWSLPARWK